MFLFFGLSSRYNLRLDNAFELGRFITPYAQLTAATSNFGGFLGNAQLGLSLTAYSNWALNLGYEYKAYYYSIDGNLSNTQKNGFVVGAGFSF